MQQRRSQAGFSLFETVMASTLFAVVVGFTFSVLSIARDSWNTGNSLSDLQFEGERALRRITSELRQANPNQITITASPNRDADSIRFTIPTDGSDAGTSVLSDTTRRLEYGNQIDYFYDSATKSVQRRELDANNNVVVAPQIVANSVKSLRFDGDAGALVHPKAVTATVTAEKVLRPQAATSTTSAKGLRRFAAAEEVRPRNDEGTVAIVYGQASTTNAYATTTGLTPVTTTTTTRTKGKTTTVTTTVAVTPTS